MAADSGGAQPRKIVDVREMSADRAVSRLVDRLLRREAERASELEVSPPADDTTLDD